MTENRFASDDASAFEAAADEPASPPNRSGADARDALAFAPVPLRYRSDGLTPAKQREFVDALADTGLIHVAAQRLGAAAEDEEEEETGDDDVWEDEDGGFWWTRFPPPEDFDGVEDGVVGEEEYRRSLTEAEEAAMKGRSEEDARERAEEIIGACARRDSYFGFAGGLDTSMLDEDILEATLKAEQGGFFFAREAETSETSAPDAPNPEPDSGSFQHPATSLAAVESRA